MKTIIYRKPRQFNDVSRYTTNRQIVDKETTDTYLESMNKIKLFDDGHSIYHMVEKGESGRLDIISNHYYGTPTFYWAIAYANNIIDPLVVVEGTLLRIPSYESLFITGGPLISRG